MINIKQKWFYELLEDVNLKTTSFIERVFPDNKFVVLSQEEKDNYVEREIMFILGPYSLCYAKNKLKINDIIREWTKDEPHIPFGKMFDSKNLTRTLVSKTQNSRKYKILGEIEAEIEETFFDLTEINISVFCGKVQSDEKDISIVKDFQLKNKANLSLFAESYPFSRMIIQKGIFDSGTVYGGYGENGPETFFIRNGDDIKINKNTLFANEKRKEDKEFLPEIINYNGIKLAILVCYDLLNPKLSYFLSKQNLDLILVPSMIPKEDTSKWEKFIYARGQEIQCSIILASNEDKRDVCSPEILFYDATKETVFKKKESLVITLKIGKNKLTKSPKVHWSWLLKNKVFGPFTDDFN